MDPLVVLPREIIKEILQCLNWGYGQFSLTAVNHQWREAALPALYNNIFFRDQDQLRLFLRSVTENEELGPLVEHASFGLLGQPNTDDFDLAILARTPNLRSVRIWSTAHHCAAPLVVSEDCDLEDATVLSHRIGRMLAGMLKLESASLSGSHLSRCMYYEVINTGWDLDDRILVLQNPSLEVLELKNTCSALRSDERHRVQLLLSGCSSGLKTLKLVNCHFDMGTMEKMLSLPRALERFEYHRYFQGGQCAYCDPCDCSPMAKALINQAASLRHLVLENLPPDTLRGNFQHLPALESLSIDMNGLFDHELDYSSIPLSRILPPSLEKLHLLYNWYAAPEVLRWRISMLEYLAAGIPKHLPRLTTVMLRSRTMQDWNSSRWGDPCAKKTQHLFAEIGIKLSWSQFSAHYDGRDHWKYWEGSTCCPDTTSVRLRDYSDLQRAIDGGEDSETGENARPEFTDHFKEELWPYPWPE